MPVEGISPEQPIEVGAQKTFQPGERRVVNIATHALETVNREVQQKRAVLTPDRLSHKSMTGFAYFKALFTDFFNRFFASHETKMLIAKVETLLKKPFLSFDEFQELERNRKLVPESRQDELAQKEEQFIAAYSAMSEFAEQVARYLDNPKELYHELKEGIEIGALCERSSEVRAKRDELLERLRKDATASVSDAMQEVVDDIDDPRVLYAIGVQYLRQGNTIEAKKRLGDDFAQIENESDKQLLMKAGRILIEEGRTERGLVFLKKALPESRELLFECLLPVQYASFFRLTEEPMALAFPHKDLNEALEYAPGKVVPFALARFAYDNDDKQTAKALLKPLLNPPFDHEEALSLMVQMLFEEGKLDEAVDLIEKAQTYAPREIDFFALAKLANENHNTAAAKSLLNHLLIPPYSHEEALSLMVTMLFEEGNFDEAILLLQRALRGGIHNRQSAQRLLIEGEIRKGAFEEAARLITSQRIRMDEKTLQDIEMGLLNKGGLEALHALSELPGRRSVKVAHDLAQKFFENNQLSLAYSWFKECPDLATSEDFRKLAEAFITSGSRESAALCFAQAIKKEAVPSNTLKTQMNKCFSPPLSLDVLAEASTEDLLLLEETFIQITGKTDGLPQAIARLIAEQRTIFGALDLRGETTLAEALLAQGNPEGETRLLEIVQRGDVFSRSRLDAAVILIKHYLAQGALEPALSLALAAYYEESCRLIYDYAKEHPIPDALQPLYAFIERKLQLPSNPPDYPR